MQAGGMVVAELPHIPGAQSPVWQATTVDAVWPPGSTLEFEYSIFEPRTGYSGNGITVSVAFNPTPTKSTLANCVMEIL